MAINKIITLTEKGRNAGPDYDVYYSSDCSNYTLATSSMYLPSVGSTGSVSVADNTLCIKLVNLSPNCNENDVVIDFRNTTTTTVPVPPPFTTTTTTIAPGPTTTTTQGPFPTTTTYGPSAKVVAHNCQNFYDFNTYRVPGSPTPEIGNVYKDAYGMCYYVTSIPSDQTLPGVGDLTYVGTSGSCSSSACITTTTTAAPYCNQWQVTNSTGAGYPFKYYYCGQTQATYLEVAANSSVIVCTQNDRIYNSFNAPLTFTNLNTSCIGTTTTTTLAPDLWRVVAHSCQDYYDFNTYGVNKNITPTVNIGDVFKDTYGTCYYVTSIPSDQTLPVVGILSFVGGSGACSSSACVTTTTTQSPFCNTWKVENLNGFGQNFKYQYCGQTNYLYPEVPANSSLTVCVQNNRIYNSFSSSLVFTNLNTVCNATTTTTTTQGPVVKFTAANCQNIYDFNVYQAASASYSLGDVFKDSYGTCYQILSFNGTAAVGTLTFVGAAGACSSPQCVTTTTTLSPFCNLWQVENPFGAAYSFKYKYCGQTDFQYPSVAPFSSASFCVQNNEIYNAFGAPLVFTNLSASCNATTTTTTTTLAPTTTTTTTRAPYCAIFNVVNNFGAGYNISYVYCGQTAAQYVEIAPNSSASFCVQNAQISNLGNPLTITETTSSCNATTTTTTTTAAPTTTTTTTRAPYCSIWNATNNFGAGYTIQWTYCSESVSRYTEIPANSTLQFCVQSGKISNLGAPILLSETTSSCAGGITTTTTSTTTSTTSTTTTTAAPTTTTTTIGNQKVIIESCEGPGDVTTPIQLAVNGPRLTNGKVVKIVGGFAGLDCYTITNSNYTGSTIYNAAVEAQFNDCTTCQSPTTTTTIGPTTTTIAPPFTFGTLYAIEYPRSGSQYTTPTAYYADCLNNLTSVTASPNTSRDFCSIWSLEQLRDWNPGANIVYTGNRCCNNVTTTTLAPAADCYNSASILITDSTWAQNAFFTVDNCADGNSYLYHLDTAGSPIIYGFDECYVSGTINGAYGSVVTIISAGNQCNVWPNTTTTTSTTTTTTSTTTTSTTTLPPQTFITGSGGITGSFVSGSLTYKYHKFTSTGSTQFNVTNGFTTSSMILLVAGGGAGGTGDINSRFGGGGGAGGTKLFTDISLYSGSYTVSVGYGGFWASNIQFNGAASSVINSSTTPFPLSISVTAGGKGGNRNLNVGNGGSGGGGGLGVAGGTGIAGEGFAGGSGIGASVAAGGGGASEIGGASGTLQNGGNGLQFNVDGTLRYFGGGGGGGTFGTSAGVGGLGGGGNASVSQGGSGQPGTTNTGGGGGAASYNYAGAGFGGAGGSGIVYIVYPIGTASTTTTTTSTTTTTTSTTTTSTTTTTTTAAPTTTTTTTTAAPYNYVSGAALIYDFGNASSYSGTGTLVYDVSGNAITGSLVNSPTFSSSNGGYISLNGTNQYVTYSGSFNSAFTVQMFWRQPSSGGQTYPAIALQAQNNGIELGIDTGFTNLSGVYAQMWYGASGNTGTGAFIDASAGTDIRNTFKMFSFNSNGTNSHKYYVNSSVVATNTSTYDRTLFTPSSQTAYLGFNSQNAQYQLGDLMGYLVYPFQLSDAEIAQNVSVFTSRV